VAEVGAVGTVHADSTYRLGQEASMKVLGRVIGWAVVGAAGGAALMFVGLLAYQLLFESSTDAAVRGFQAGARIMGAIGGGVLGALVGGLIGALRSAEAP